MAEGGVAGLHPSRLRAQSLLPAPARAYEEFDGVPASRSLATSSTVPSRESSSTKRISDQFKLVPSSSACMQIYPSSTAIRMCGHAFMCREHLPLEYSYQKIQASPPNELEVSGHYDVSAHVVGVKHPVR
ncbi:hypothetical protein DFH06DRAFT_1326441 [Mycena polygramma]|nr:hypothetical protein DFH06DRAFT_1326441 [Mycena polygramma]